MDSLSVVGYKDVDRDVWDELIPHSSDAWMWHLHSFQDTVAAWPHKEAMSVGVLDGSRLAAILPLHLYHRRVFGLHFGWLESLGGPAFSRLLDETVRHSVRRLFIEHLNRLVRRHRCFRIEIRRTRLGPSERWGIGEVFEPFYPAAKIVPTFSWIVDLRRGQDDIWEDMQGRARTAIRKAERNGVIVRAASASERDLDTYYDLHCQTYSRTGATPHPRLYFERIWQNHVASGSAKIWFAFLNDQEPVAAANVAVFDRAAQYWTGASTTEGLRTEANSAIQWAAIRWMIDSGVAIYDVGEGFEAPTGKARGLNDFKRSFGGRLLPVHHEIADVGDSATRLLRNATREVKRLRGQVKRV